MALSQPFLERRAGGLPVSLHHLGETYWWRASLRGPPAYGLRVGQQKRFEVDQPLGGRPNGAGVEQGQGGAGWIDQPVGRSGGPPNALHVHRVDKGREQPFEAGQQVGPQAAITQGMEDGAQAGDTGQVAN
eukprot:GAFH01002704.1.p2 GENE.GAFH01002704.1~~GAFH01002704.1.p2  ORF type:complete len:131 (+),score=24.96 GAFH01002704.1:142-534(+)